MQYPTAFIDRIKNHFRLSEVIGKRINVRRHGKEYQALCPFHGEKTPSFTINDEKGFYYCFGCGVHGDVITFVMEHDRLTYPQAIELIASQAGISIPKPDAANIKRASQEDKLLAACFDAAGFFKDQLNASLGHNARRYLEGRGVNSLIINEFQIGYAPIGRESLKLAMLQAGHSEATLIEAGLIIKVDDKPAYDRFRGRIMFPIKRLDGKVIAFGGRLIDNNTPNQPKYLNSPETPLFNKKHTLYNLDKIKQMRDLPNLVVVEGYMDVVALHMAGIKYVVAPLGTAFGEEHLSTLWRFHNSPIMCFDGDKAGQKAMLRAAEIALPHLTTKKHLRFCGLPNGEDPDSYVRESGLDVMQKLLERSLTMSELLWNRFIGNRNFTTPEALAIAEAQMMEQVVKISDDNLRKRIITAYKSRLWHISKQHHAKTPISTPQIMAAGKSATLEQAFALIAHFPALMNDQDIEHALYNWDWRVTNFAGIISKILTTNHETNLSREKMRSLIMQDKTAFVYLQQKYASNIIPPSLHLTDEYDGLMQAKLLFSKLQNKIEQREVLAELYQIASSENQSEQEQKLVELIKMQQKRILNQAINDDEPYS
jgi:DNA primase